MCVAEKLRRSIVVWGVHVIEPAMELLLRMPVCMFIDQSLELLEVDAQEYRGPSQGAESTKACLP